MIKHVNRSYSFNTIVKLKCIHQKHTYCTCTHGSDTLHTDIKPGHRETHTDACIPETDRHRHTSFRLTTTHQPPLLPAMWLRLPRSATDAFCLMHGLLTACLSISPTQPPTIKSHQASAFLLQIKPKTKYLSQGACKGGFFSVSPQNNTTSTGDRGKKKIQSGADEWGKKQRRFTVPSPFHPPLPPPVCLFSVQLWLCDAKLMGAKLSSIHTLAYNVLRLIPTHQC